VIRKRKLILFLWSINYKEYCDIVDQINCCLFFSPVRWTIFWVLIFWDNYKKSPKVSSRFYCKRWSLLELGFPIAISGITSFPRLYHFSQIFLRGVGLILTWVNLVFSTWCWRKETMVTKRPHARGKMQEKVTKMTLHSISLLVFCDDIVMSGSSGHRLWCYVEK